MILIDHFNGIERATAYLAATQGQAAISVITRAEVLAGFDEAGAIAAQGLLDCYPTLPIEKETADVAAQLRRRYRFRLPDALQAALALRNRLRLVTRNTKDFPPDRHPYVLVPYNI
ncbi:MAG: PIN domain-containing protein [Nitrospirae bacterium]|nr:PIN domain-containing protein [Nitrospirota bacterium]MBI3392462.1 PIN domain-containing protein [Nitrospirota bacterium]